MSRANSRRETRQCLGLSKPRCESNTDPWPLPPWPLPFRPHPPPRGQLRQFSEMFMCNSLPWAKPKEPVDRGSTAPRIRSVSRTPSNLPQQSESPCGVGNGALLSSRLRHPQSLSALHDRTPISHLLISRKLRLMNLDHGLLKLAPQIFRRGRALRLNIMGLNRACSNMVYRTLVCHWGENSTFLLHSPHCKTIPTLSPYCAAPVDPQ